MIVLILDFANTTDTIMKAFEPYYEATFLRRLLILISCMSYRIRLDYHVFDESEVDEFVHAYLRGDSQAVLHNILSLVKDEFVKLTKRISGF